MITEFKKYIKLHDLHDGRWKIPARYLKYCSEKGVDYLNATYDDFQEYFLSVKGRGVAKNTFNTYLMGVRLFYKFLIESGRVGEDKYAILKKFKLHKVENKVKAFLTKEELAELIQMGETFCSYMDVYKLKALLYFMFYTGLRKGEIIHLRRADIDLVNHTVIVKTPTKNRIERVVPFPKTVAATKHNRSFDFSKMLQDYFDSEGEVSNAFNMTDDKFEFLFNSLKEYAPEKKLTPHLMRHSFARMLAKHGIDSRVAQKLLGHKNIATTMIYYDPDIDTIQDIYNEKVK